MSASDPFADNPLAAYRLARKEPDMDSGLMYAWLPKLFVFALGLSIIGRIVVRRRSGAWLSGAMLPILYELARAVRETGFAEPSQNSQFWSHDMPLLCAIGLLATMPGALVGTIIGGVARKGTRVS